MNPIRKRLLGHIQDALATSIRFFSGQYFNERYIGMHSIKRIKELLMSDNTLRSTLKSDPTVAELPYRKSDMQKQVVIWLPFQEEFLTRRNLISAVQTSIRKAQEQSLLEPFEQVCVGSYVGKNLAGEGRVLCVMVEKDALTNVLSLRNEEFLGCQDATREGWFANAIPAPGVRVSWYRNPHNIPE